MRLKVRQGDLDEALRQAESGFHKYSQTNREWALRFREQEAHILVYKKSLKAAFEILKEELPSELATSDIAVHQRMDLGIAYLFSGQYPPAQENLEEAERLARSHQPNLLGDVQQAQGTLYFYQKKYVDAGNAFTSALTISRRQNEPFLEASALGSLGNVAMGQEHYDEATEWYKAALQLSTKLQTKTSIATTLGNMGWSYFELGDFENALPLYKQAALESERNGLPASQAYWLTSVANTYYAQRQYQSAEAVLKQTQKLVNGLDEKSALLECLNDLSALALEAGDIAAAERYNKDATGLGGAAVDHSDVLSSKLIEARIQSTKRHFDEAKQLFQQVLEDANAETPLRWEAKARLAKLYDDENRADAAEKEYREAIETFEDARESVGQDELRLSFLASGIEYFDDFVEFLIGHGRPSEALKAAEFSRAPTLMEALSPRAKTERLSFQSMGGVQPQQIARHLHATLLFYWLGEKHSYLWVITPSKTTYFTLPAEAEIDPLVKSYREALLGTRDPLETANAAGQKLYTMLVEPAKKLIPQGSRVIVLPDGSLYGLNFETLIVPDPKPHYWIEDATLATGSSLTLLASAAARSAPKDKRLFLVGDTVQPSSDFPALQQALAEMKNVEKYFPESRREVLSGSQATPAAYLSSDPERFAYLHFVTHGIASRTRPLESAVILSKEKDTDSYKLYAREIVKQRLAAYLVTISACNGAGTRAYSGEGLVGLSWAFLRAGAHNVIGALWEVSDMSTPQFMDTLYGGLSRGEDPATALRAAKLSFLHSDGVYKKPFYWAPFQLYAGS